MSHLIQNIEIESVTIENYFQLLPGTLINQIQQFIPPSGSFDNKILRRYLINLRDYEEEDSNSTLTLANRLRLAFFDMKADTICGRFPQAELSLKRRLRCVAEYLIRAQEFDKVKDEAGNLIKKRGVIGKLVCIYQPLPKLLESLQKQGFISS